MGDISLNDVTNSSDIYDSVTNKATCISLNDVTNSSDIYDSVGYKRGQSATVPSDSVTKKPVRCRNILIIALFAIVALAVAVTIVVLVVLKKSGDDPVPASPPPEDCGEAVWEKADISNQTGTTFGSTATSACRPGFDGGSQTVTCGADKQWTGDLSCTPLNCGWPGFMNSEMSFENGTTFGSNIRATCHLGFDGVVDIVCNSDGHWIGSRCIRSLDCGGVPERENADISNQTGTTFGSTAIVTCRLGFNGGSQIVSCGSDRGWTGAPIICTPIDCGDAVWKYADISNQTGTTFGSTATATCLPGESQTVTCGANNQWTGGQTCLALVQEKCNQGAVFLPHPDECQVYYDCSKPGHTAECTYPQQFNPDIMACDNFTKVDCGSRADIKEYCEYRANQCSFKCQTPCYVFFPSCLGLSDGNNVYQYREWSAFYATCFQERLVSTDACPYDEGSEIFHPELKQCVLLDKIPQEDGGTMPDCSGLSDGLHVDYRDRCSQYTVCESEIAIDTVKCPDGLVFDSATLTCVSLEQSCSPPPCGDPSNC